MRSPIRTHVSPLRKAIEGVPHDEDGARMTRECDYRFTATATPSRIGKIVVNKSEEL